MKSAKTLLSASILFGILCGWGHGGGGGGKSMMMMMGGGNGGQMPCCSMMGRPMNGMGGGMGPGPMGQIGGGMGPGPMSQMGKSNGGDSGDAGPMGRSMNGGGPMNGAGPSQGMSPGGRNPINFMDSNDMGGGPGGPEGQAGGPPGAFYTAAVNTNHEIDFSEVPTTRNIQSANIVIGASEIPLNILFKSTSSSMNIMQQHNNKRGESMESFSQDEPFRLFHTVTKPIWQDVREVITPFRRVTQEIHPVQEDIKTVIAKGFGDPVAVPGPQDGQDQGQQGPGGQQGDEGQQGPAGEGPTNMSGGGNGGNGGMRPGPGGIGQGGMGQGGMGQGGMGPGNMGPGGMGNGGMGGPGGMRPRGYSPDGQDQEMSPQNGGPRSYGKMSNGGMRGPMGMGMGNRGPEPMASMSAAMRGRYVPEPLVPSGKFLGSRMRPQAMSTAPVETRVSKEAAAPIAEPKPAEAATAPQAAVSPPAPAPVLVQPQPQPTELSPKAEVPAQVRAPEVIKKPQIDTLDLGGLRIIGLRKDTPTMAFAASMIHPISLSPTGLGISLLMDKPNYTL